MSLVFSRSLSTFELQDEIYGHSYNYWISEFWKSAFDSHKKKVRQQVYCINGRVEEQGEREPLEIPQDRAILMCPIKWISLKEKKEFEKNPTYYRKIMEDRCHYETDIIHDMTMLLDGELMSPYCTHAMSTLFECDYGENVAISEGYWLFLKPFALEKGIHKMRSFASCAKGKVKVPQEYDIKIV